MDSPKTIGNFPEVSMPSYLRGNDNYKFRVKHQNGSFLMHTYIYREKKIK